MITILDPVVQPDISQGKIAPREKSLHGKVVGLLSNGKVNADTLLDLVAEKLQKDYQIVRIVRHKKPTASRIIPDELLKIMAQECDVVLTAIGD